jgi:prephenate dehydrogenase
MIGIIGFGRFGKLTARFLAQDFTVWVYTKSEKEAIVKSIGARIGSMEKVCRQKILILCVPISIIPETIKRIAPFLKKGTVVIDVCSVKVEPIKWMTTLLPEFVSILPTHPMFGPDSAVNTLSGRKIVLCNGRIDPILYAKIKTWLEEKKLKIIETTAEDHDRKIARSLCLTHFVGRALARLGITKLDIDTEGYNRLLNILEVVENDSWQLFEDMNRYNPHAREERVAFMQAIQNVHERLES